MGKKQNQVKTESSHTLFPTSIKQFPTKQKVDQTELSLMNDLNKSNIGSDQSKTFDRINRDDSSVLDMNETYKKLSFAKNDEVKGGLDTFYDLKKDNQDEMSSPDIQHKDKRDFEFTDNIHEVQKKDQNQRRWSQIQQLTQLLYLIKIFLQFKNFSLSKHNILLIIYVEIVQMKQIEN